MDRRLFSEEASAGGARSRLQRALAISLLAPLLGAGISLAAELTPDSPAPAPDGRTIRATVAHQHFGTACFGYLYVNRDEVWYEVVKPDRFKDHAFRVQRSQIAAGQWILMGQPQNAAEIRVGRSAYHFWLLRDQDLATAPNIPVPQYAALPFQPLIAVIAAGGNPAPAPRPAPPESSAAANPESLIEEALRVLDAFRLHYRQTGDVSGMTAFGPAREKAQTAYGQFLAKRDYGKAAQSLITVADIDRMLIVQNSADFQVQQAPLRQKYADALKLAERANDAAMQYKAFIGLCRTALNSKDYVAASDHISKAIDLAAHASSKDDLFNAYEMRAEVERQRGNLSAASDYLDRALSLSGEVKDPTLLYYAYTDRADIYNNRADQCNYERDFKVCKDAFDKGMDDIRKALETAQSAGLDYLRQQSQASLDERKVLADQQAKMAITYSKLSAADFWITKPSQVILVPRFAPGANPALAAQIGNYVRQMTGPVNAGDPTRFYLEGQLEELEGNDGGALRNYSAAAKLLESDRRKLGDTAGSGAFLSDRIEIYYSAALQHLDHQQYAQAFDLLERSRARATAEMLASRKLSFRTPELQDLFSQSVDLRAQIGKAQNTLFDALSSKQADSDEVKDLQAKVDALEAQDRSLQARIRQRAPKLADLGEKPPVSMAGAQAAAREGNYDLLYYVTLGSGTVIWHIGGDSVHVVKVYYTRELMTNRIAALRKSVTDAQATFDERSAAELFLVLVNPVLPYTRTRHLVIVPHENMANLPFQVLKNPEDGSFLGERFQISYAPSATVLAGLGRRPDFTHGRLLAIADPAIASAVAEVNAIAAMYPGRAKIVTDTLASKQSLKNGMGDYNLLHLSVHGVFDTNNPLLSYLKLRPAQGDDGRLTAAEMFGLNLPENSLVVLSACETGLVKATHGNDVLGMVPALLFAGASTLVLSSWKVDAASTAIWMETFYREARTRPPSEAAQMALLSVRKQPGFRHPFYWAPFLVTGQ